MFPIIHFLRHLKNEPIILQKNTWSLVFKNELTLKEQLNLIHRIPRRLRRV